jgi:hypothetical protein
MNDNVVLINESKRTWSLPSLPAPIEIEPKNRGRLTDRGTPISKSSVELERVVRFRPPMLNPGERIEVPWWYFEKIKGIPSLKPVWNRRKDGIAVGRTRQEKLNERLENDQAAKAAELTDALSARDAAERRVADLEKRLAQTQAELAKKPKSDAKPDSGKDDSKDSGKS